MLRQSKRVFTLTVVALLVASTFLPASAQLSQWRSLNPYRDGTLPITAGDEAPFLYSVHLLSANYGWAVGGTCDIYALPVGGEPNCDGPAGSPPADLGPPGVGFALFYDGSKWRNVLVPGGAGTLTAVYAVSTTDVWAVGLGPTIIHWDGIAWTLVPAPAGLTDLFGLFMLPGGTDGWAVGDGAVDNIRWSGTFPAGAWSAGPTPNLKAAPVLRAVSLSSPTFGWIVASDGGIFKWDGAGWLPQFSPVLVDLLSVNAVSSTDAWAVGAGSTIIRWNGASWTGPMVAPTAGIDYRSIKMVSVTDGWIAGAINSVTVEALLLRWNGVAWNIVRSWITQDLNGLFMLPGGTTGSAVGDAETIIKWTNIQWISQTSPTAFPLFDVHMVSTNDGWAVGGPFLLNDPSPASEYGGSGWSVSSSPMTASFSPTTVTPTDTQTATSSQAIIWTDKPDYLPGDTPTIYGSGFNANAEISVSVIRPDGTANTWFTTSSDLGSFTTTYALDGIRGSYTVTATDGRNTATTTFTDGTKSVQCDNGSGPAKAPCTWQTGTLNAPTAYAEGDSVAYSVWIDSLTPSSTGNTVVIEYDFTKQASGGLIVLGFDFLTHPDSSEQAVSTRCSGIPGGTSVPNCAAMTSGSTVSFQSDVFTFATAGVNALLNGQTVAAREAAYSLSHPSPPREPVIFGGSITGISAPSKVGDPNTAASRSQVTITFNVDSFNANSCASATSCAVNILFGAHLAQGAPFNAGWGLDRGASDFPGSSLATSIGAGSLSIQPAALLAPTTITTTIRDQSNNPVASVIVGATVHDSATLSGATTDAGGSVVYSRYTTANCIGTPVNQTVTVTNGLVPDSSPFTTTSTGSLSYRGVYSGDANNVGSTSACEPLTINKASTTIGTELSSSSITAGGSITDSATLTGATTNAGGTVTYNVYGGSTCSGGTTDSDSVTVTNGVVPTSKLFTFPNAGDFSFQAVYSGDANNNGTTSNCSTELLSVGPNPMTITTSLSQTIIDVGASVRDSSTLSGTTLGTAGGTVTYSVFSGDACGGTALNTDTVNVASGVVPNSKWFTFNSAGTFSFLAVYSGDASHNGATSICSTEILTVNKLSPTIATVLSSMSITVGGSVFDTATLSGATSDADGTVTYYFYSDGACSSGQTQVGSPVTVTHGIVPNSALQQFNLVGSFSWNAVYSGDANNNGATSACKPLAVGKAPSLSMMGSSIFHWDGIHWFHYETLPSPNTLLGVFMLDTNDGWAVGSAVNPTSPPVILRWNGVSWVVKTPPGVALGGTLMDVHALSPTEAWAVGFGPNFGATSAPPIVKWDGTIWASVPSGLPSGYVLTDLHMLSSTDGWAVGCTTIACASPVILHWNGLAWSSVTAPAGIAGLLDVYMLGPTDGWAVGATNLPAPPGQSTIIHWDGVQWRRVPGPTGGFLTSVHMVSATDGWTVGYDTVSDLSLIVHWNGLTWDVVSTPPVPPTMNNILTSVFMVSGLDGWAVSGFTTAPPPSMGFGAGSGLFLHYGPEIVCEAATSTLTLTATTSATVTQTATSTSTTSSSTTTTVPPGLGIPGYPIAILVGLIAGVAALGVLAMLALLRRRPRRRWLWPRGWT